MRDDNHGMLVDGAHDFTNQIRRDNFTDAFKKVEEAQAKEKFEDTFRRATEAERDAEKAKELQAVEAALKAKAEALQHLGEKVECGPIQIRGFLRGVKTENGDCGYVFIIDDFLADDGTKFQFQQDYSGDVFALPTPPTKYKTAHGL